MNMKTPFKYFKKMFKMKHFLKIIIMKVKMIFLKKIDLNRIKKKLKILLLINKKNKNIKFKIIQTNIFIYKIIPKHQKQKKKLKIF